MIRLFTLLLIFIIPQTSLAQKDSQKLTVEKRTRKRTELYSGFPLIYQLFRWDTQEYIDWQGYLGEEKVSEPTFFAIAGLDSHSKKAQGRKSTRDFGFGLMVFGTAEFFFAIIAKDYRMQNILFTTGILTEVVGLEIYLGNKGNHYPYFFAEQAAERYNQEIR